MSEIYDQLIYLIRRAGMLETIEEHLDWDQKTMMPEGEEFLKAEQISLMKEMRQEIMSAKKSQD